MPPTPSALLRFHVSVGARLAMRALVPAIVGAVTGGMLLGDDFLVTLAHSLFGPESSGGSWAMIALVAMGAASMAAPGGGGRGGRDVGEDGAGKDFGRGRPLPEVGWEDGRGSG